MQQTDASSGEYKKCGIQNDCIHVHTYIHTYVRTYPIYLCTVLARLVPDLRTDTRCSKTQSPLLALMRDKEGRGREGRVGEGIREERGEVRKGDGSRGGDWKGQNSRRVKVLQRRKKKIILYRGL